MTRIWNPYVFTPLGNPIVGEAPPVLRVMGGMQATAQQLSYAQQRFTQFVMQARLSTVPNPTEAGSLPDGTRYRIVKVGPQTTMEIWPQPQDDGVFIAWTAFFNAAHLPIWERPVVDFPYDDLPPKPEPPGPAPKYPKLAETGLLVETETPAPGTTLTRYIAFAEVLGGGRIAEATAEGTHTFSEGPCGAGHFVSSNHPSVGTYSMGGESFHEVFTYTYDYLGGPYKESVAGGIILYHTPNPCAEEPTTIEIFVPRVNTGIRLSVVNAAHTYNVNAIAAYNAASTAWQAAYDQYVADLAEWNALLNELLALNRPWWPVVPIRQAARPQQIADVKAHLMNGIGDRHLTARILSFPYNVTYRTEPPVGAGGSVTHEWVVEDTQRGFKSTLTNAQPYTVYPAFDEASAGTYPAHVLRRDIMPPECLFGWTASGEFSYVNRYYASQRSFENYIVAPPGLDSLAVTFASDYFETTRLIPDAGGGHVVAADAFVPVGSKFTIVLFEYLVADPRTGDSVWTTCPDVLQYDSIWIREGGTYIDTPIVGDVFATQRVRIAGAFEQTRTSWSTWSAPVPVSIAVQPGWEAEFELEMPSEQPCKAPSAVVIANNLSPAANPASAQLGGRYLDAAHLWNGAPDAVRTARASGWVKDGATAPQRQFIVRALIATGKIKP